MTGMDSMPGTRSGFPFRNGLSGPFYSGDRSTPLTKSNLVLSHNLDDSDAIGGNKVGQQESTEAAMGNASRYRALASLCRQQAAYNPLNSWHLLGQAERWEHLAEAEIAEHFNETNVGNLPQARTIIAHDMRWKDPAAA
jgi:hypothetical protein